MKKTKFRKISVIGITIIFLILSVTSEIGGINPSFLTIKNKKPINTGNTLHNEEFIEAKHYSINQVFLENKILGLIKERFFEKLIYRLMKIGHMSALSAAVIKNNEIVWAKGFGIYDREKNKQATEETIYLVASISKSFTATAIMQLYEKGCFDLDDDVNDYLPFNLRNPNHPDKPITFRMLLSHQSSLATEREDLSNFVTRIIPGGMEITGYPYPFLKEYLTPDGLYYQPQFWTDNTPGEEMHYSNIGFGILGYLVEILSNKSFEEYCQENIFEPLGMRNTSFKFANVNATMVAVPYDFDSGEFYPIMHYDILDTPAGGLRTTVLDLSRFLIAHMNNGEYHGVRILNESTIKLMHTIQSTSDNYKFHYGLGWQIWMKPTDILIGHTGGLLGVSTKMVFRQSDNTGIIFFTNKQITNMQELFVFSLVEKLLFWKADGYKTWELQKEKLWETILSNEYLLKDFKNEEKIKKIKWLYSFLRTYV
ncbi:MAG: hypothetical protein DRM99_04080 [Thermoplasmata archaeon]|nr:MAG: hypothetical protein DRM99_04080 [Thermoplasmata archaeon]